MDAGIQTGIHYPVPVHLQPAYRDPRYKEGDLPVAEQAASQVLSLPIFPELHSSQIETICGTIRGHVGAPTGG
jgi:dTDP-4-amino-4,6-dideoxygalactose transaminase